MSDLLPCPFCGSPAEQGNDYEPTSACCTNKNCAGSTVECWDSEWNTRAPSATSAGVDDSETLSAVIEEMRGRERVGIPKYGVTVDRTDLTSAQWATHLSEELMDALLYLKRMQTIETNCTCPSGDGSLRWPCPKHPPGLSDANQKAGMGEVARDAERYRWLKDHLPPGTFGDFDVFDADSWNKAIDAAIQSAARGDVS